MKVCFAALTYPVTGDVSGVAIHVQAVGRYLVRRGHKATVLVKEPPRGLPQYDDHGVKLIGVHIGKLHWYLSRLPVLRVLAEVVREMEYSWAIWQSFRGAHFSESFDLVQCTESGGLFLRLLKRWHGCPIVVRLHGEKGTIYRHRPEQRVGLGLRMQRLLQLVAIRGADRLTSPSSFHARNVQAEVGRELPIAVLPNFVAAENLVEVAGIAEWPPELAELRSRPIVLYAGRIERGKGVEPLLRAVPLVARQCPEVCFVFVGASHPNYPPAELKELIGQLRVENSVRFIDALPRRRLWAFYRAATVVAMPSYYETFGNTYIEAMAMSKPVVGFAGTSLEEILGDSPCGVVTAKGKIEELARQIGALLAEPEKAHAMGELAHDRVLSAFVDHDVLPRVEALYEEVTGLYGVGEGQWQIAGATARHGTH